MEIGAVLTSTEMDGCAPAADWSRWILQGRAPHSGAGSGPGPGPELQAAEDVAQLASLGVSNVALTLEWARLEPRPRRYDTQKIERLTNTLNDARSKGLTVWGCLVDGTLPGWFHDDDGGFGDDHNQNLVWPRHVDWIGEHFGDLVDGWIPQREPIRWALRRFLLAKAPPGSTNSAAATKGVDDALKADGQASRLLAGTQPVAAFHTVRRVDGLVDNIKAAPKARWLRALMNDSWQRAVTEGDLRESFDRVIVQLRSGIVVDADGQWLPHPASGPEMAIADLRAVSETLATTPIVAAGDLADVKDSGRSRPDHLRYLLDHVAEAGRDLNVIGWWQTSPIDGYHWERGFELHPGLIDRSRNESPTAEILKSAKPDVD